MTDRTLVQRYITDGNDVQWEAYITQVKARRASKLKKKDYQIKLWA